MEILAFLVRVRVGHVCRIIIWIAVSVVSSFFLTYFIFFPSLIFVVDLLLKMSSLFYGAQRAG